MKIIFFAYVGLLVLSLTSCRRLVAREDDNTQDETEQTRNVSVRIHGRRVSSTLINGVHAPRIRVHLMFKNNSYDIDLVLNTYLLSASYVERIITGNNVTYRNVDQDSEMCYYNGAIQHEKHSSAAFSTCEGIKGFFVLNNSTFHITPLRLDNSSLFGLYEIKKINNDKLSQWICGIDDLKKQVDEIHSNQRVKRQIIPESLDGQNVVELYVANDNRRLKFFNNDVNKLSRSTREIANVANLLYQPVGFFVVLVGTEYWNTDQIDVSTDSSQTLPNWLNYRFKNVLNKHYNDNGFLISKQTFEASVLGLANIGSMCSSKTSGGIMTAIDDNSAVSGAILAHEMGHNFGLSHDSADCQCESPTVSCIMSARASIYAPATFFSSCSKAQLRKAVDDGFDICLKDFPSDLNNHSPVCGNGILENGEECDCGRMPTEECNPRCCDVNTCRLISSAKCASGKCCDVNSCQVKQAGVQCRSAIGTCDLPETCDGRSAYCPKNTYLHDGTSCSVGGVSAYCWSGMCRTPRSQCQLLFGPSASEGDNNCYTVFNVQGSMNGWCKIKIADPIEYTRCETANVLCGSLQCTPNSANLIRYKNFFFMTVKNIGSNQCKAAIIDYGTRVENPGMVPNGASCGAGRMCISQQCVSARDKLNENACPVCMRGVCTNEGRCACDPGYFGPACDSVNPVSTNTFPVGGIIAIVIIFILLFTVPPAIYFIYKKCDRGFISKTLGRLSAKVPQSPIKIRSSRSEVTSVYLNDPSGQDNKAYVPDAEAISVISRNNIITTNNRISSFYPRDDNRETYEELDPSIFREPPPPRPIQLPSAPKRQSAYKLNLTPVSSPPPVPSQQLKPNKIKSKAPTQSLKPTTAAPKAPNASRPAVPPSSAKPKFTPAVGSVPPARPKLPPNSAPPPPPTFLSKPKFSKVAPMAPEASSMGRAANNEEVGDVRRLKAMFEKDSIA